jgi:hypothetical protein
MQEDVQEVDAVLVFQYSLLSIVRHGDVIEGICEFDPERAGHAGTLAEKGHIKKMWPACSGSLFFIPLMLLGYRKHAFWFRHVRFRI